MKFSYPLLSIAKFLVIIIIFGSAFSSTAHAAITLAEEPSKLCQCETGVFKYDLRNDASVSKDFSVTLTGTAASWASAAPKQVSLSAGSSRQFFIFVTPPCYTKPGTYSFRVQAGEYAREQSFKVENCHAVSVQMPKSEELCAGETIDVPVTIENTGDFNDKFTLTSNLGSLKEDHVLIEKGDKYSTKVSFSPKQPGDFKLSVTAQNIKLADTKDTDSTDVVAKNCADFSLDWSAGKPCVGEVASISVTIKNTGKNSDSYQITGDSTAEGLEFDKKTLSLGTGSSANVRALVKPEKIGDNSYLITVRSDSGIVKKISAVVRADSCASFELINDHNKTVCLGEEATYDVSVKNTGKLADSYTLASSEGSFGRSSLSVKSGEMNGTVLTVKSDKAGERDIQLSAMSSEGLESRQRANLIVEKCCNLAAITVPKTIDVCAGSKASIVTQLGILGLGGEEKYEIVSDQAWLKPEKRYVTLNKSKEELVNLRIKTPDKTGVYTALIVVSSEYCSDNAYIKLNVKDCRGVAARQPTKLQMCSSQTATTQIAIENTGYLEDTFELSLDGPSWMKLDKKEIKLKGREVGYVTISMEPSSAGAESKEYTGILTMKSKSSPSASASVTHTVEIMPKDKCYCIQAQFEPKELSIAQCSNNVTELHITNCGLVADRFSFSVEGTAGKWAVIEPKDLILEPGASGITYLAIAVPVDAEVKNYDVAARVTGNKGSSAEAKFAIKAKAYDASLINGVGSPGNAITGLPTVNITNVSNTSG